MPTEPATPTLAEIVRRAVEVCDPAGTSEAAADLLQRFEDRDEPITAIADVDAQLSDARGALDLEGDDPALTMAAAVTVYLAHRRTQTAAEREEILRLAARAEFGGDPPPHVADWLRAEGVEP